MIELSGSQLLGALSALMAALVFGAGDFSGGFAARRQDQYQALALSALASVGVLVVLTLLWRESLPDLQNTLWATLAGTAGAFGLAVLYRGLAEGSVAMVSPTAGVVGATLPVAVSAFVEGLPSLEKYAGFTLALGGIWLVTRVTGDGRSSARQGLWLGVLSGLGFGAFFIFLDQIDSGTVFAPLLAGKLASLLVALLLLRARRLPAPSPRRNPVALLAGALDAGANVFYLLATKLTRLDVAVVLSSLYPAVTVLLALVVFKEKIAVIQWLGVLLCLAAIGLIVY